ncbi:hypothetical protein IEQ11_22310 [Lysobacter capsici]|uniref:hypothetical protein n=1 Tax=Lysobacter capsici TaxID=435897 RepID=UPI00177B44B0|nr:hypothetical protein [Lysobacter capsici]UOF14421.1 hypothetical protein IEQ11_22310 [Lysobacter capsici]
MPTKARPRLMTIGTAVYLWIVRSMDPQHVVLKVWSRQRGRKDFPLEVRFRFDDPWLNYGPIITTPSERRHEFFELAPVTPKMVCWAIDAAIAAGWNPEQPREHRLFERGLNGDLLSAQG